ncbi:hypothetical protein TSAR_005621 [Trichomalopsis sarcophagae]|uniref:Uncharacterized protein n=1 Tax=Trichomalopsis sarcophagae TaxID=543379 RepID=A0A232ED09_9HYME|nr:hypothetical protein TSAR_005621 [Trichomalopsis sarcophagae]
MLSRARKKCPVSVEHFAAHRGGQLVWASGVREHVRCRTMLLLGPTDDCLDCSRQFQVNRRKGKMSVKSAILKQLEERYVLLSSRMERASRLIQQLRDTYAELYEEREELKSALRDLENSPSVGPVNSYKPRLGDVARESQRLCFLALVKSVPCPSSISPHIAAASLFGHRVYENTLLGPTDDCLDCSRQFQVNRRKGKMSVKSAILKQLEERYVLLSSRMERASRLIQQLRDTYAELYEEREELKSALRDLENSPSVGPVNSYKPRLGDVCEMCARIMRRMTKRTQWSFCTECRSRRCTTCSRKELLCCSLQVVRRNEMAEAVIEEKMPQQQQQPKEVHADQDYLKKEKEEDDEDDEEEEEAKKMQDDSTSDTDIDVGEEFFTGYFTSNDKFSCKKWIADGCLPKNKTVNDSN